MELMESLLFFLIMISIFQQSSSSTNPGDVSALKSLSEKWKNAPPSWGKSGDPCGESGERWEGVLNCSNSRVTELKLFNMGLEGTLSSEIGSLTGLQSLDLSYNKDLEGELPSSIGMLKQLHTLRLIACKFSGIIPNELGNLQNLKILALNSNQFSGKIPASLGRLSHLQYLDLADNQLNGTLPTSATEGSGLDRLWAAQHFHFNKNQISGPIPSDLFNSSMTVMHILLDNNKLTGEIPDTIGLVNSLRILRLDNNSLNGSVPSSINSLTNLSVLNLANNNLNGAMPNLTGMDFLNYLDLSNNSFDPSEAPNWLSGLNNLTTLIIESGGLQGQVPQEIFSFPQLQEVRLNNNSFSGTLNMSTKITQALKIVNLRNNSITSVTLSSSYNDTLILIENPVCGNVQLRHTGYCQDQQPDSQFNSWNNVTCSQPYEGQIVSRAPYFGYIQNHLNNLEERIQEKLSRTGVNFLVQDVFFDKNSYLNIWLKFCNSSGKSFTRNDILNSLDLNTQDLQLPENIGPSVFYPSHYAFQKRVIRGLTIGIAVGCAIGVLIIAGLAIYAVRQRKQALTAIYLRNPFASWGSFGEDAGDAPQLKGARCFSLDELKRCTDDFSKANEIGSGGYGKVYKGVLLNDQIVAIKRSQKGSTQGGLEFKTEIELLSRVHHRNLVELVGFCYEKGELLLVYEYIPNGTLKKNLSGSSEIQLDWKRRLMIALDSARGLAYLHDHANPPIIHRDVKSTNILLDDNLIAKVADFGLSTFVLNSEEGLISIHIKGTPGYVDPEYFMTHQLTAKSDVYSFGVVMLELITARSPIEKEKYIVKEVKMAINKNDKEFYGLKDLIDPTILKTGSLDGMHRFIELTLKCLAESPEDRPMMNELVKEFEILLTKHEIRRKSTSESSFGIEFQTERGVAEHPYDEIVLSSEVSTDAGYYSGQHLLPK
ncbi:putative leucine-rich repeat receptor-like protein kinase [Canna indica]|uniref:non-specific serine/threonine protein kinase n=1 Tax=Canna indica TaxID=4628 RepID=A0AAQ3Q2D0_9LILI|nr:putative leucine-rich repeat receptor-like protein kinase [Canna indica]